MAGTSPPGPRREADAARLAAVRALAERCHYERQHTRQVTRLALALFDELVAVHGFGDDERFWLRCGALLHDIGWIDGQKGHHKTALRLILDDEDLPLDGRERLLVATIARYHRKALPKEPHEHYAALDPDDRRRVQMLAGILRVADGLDRTHVSVVRSLTCDVSDDRVLVRCRVTAPAASEVAVAMEKGDLLQQALGCRLVIQTARDKAD